MCLHCNERYGSLHDLVALQKQRQLFGGYFILNRPHRRHRRRPVRLGSEIEVENEDNATGSYSLLPCDLAYCDSSDDDQVAETDDSESLPCPKVPSSEEVVPSAHDTVTGNSDQDDGRTSNLQSSFFSQNASTSSFRTSQSEQNENEGINGNEMPLPTWVSRLNMKGITFNKDYSRYWCACKRTPTPGWVTGGSCGNLKKHRRNGSCLYDSKQLRIGEMKPRKRMTQAKLRHHCSRIQSTLSGPRKPKVQAVGDL